MRFFNFFFFTFLVLYSVFLLLGGCQKSTLIPENNVAQVPPPLTFPQEKDSVMVIDDVKFTISSYLWQDFMPMIPPDGPPFYLNLEIEIQNNSGKEIRDFSALMITLYYPDTQTIFHDFKLIPAANTKPEEIILPQERRTLSYTNEREEIFSPQIEKGIKLYGRIMVKWNGKEYLLTSPPQEVIFTY